MTRVRSPEDAGQAGHRRRGSAAPHVMRTIPGALALVLLLAACGKVGPVRPPGPPDQVTHPRQYPNR